MMRRSIHTAILASACLTPGAFIAPNADADGKFDGRWTAVLVTESGPCAPSYRGEVQVMDGLVRIEGQSENSFSGRVSPSGAVTVMVSMGNSYGVGTGRLSSTSGGGKWHAKTDNGACAGTWSAERN